VDILQPCVSFNRERAYDFYKDRVYKLEEDAAYDSSNRAMAWERAQEWGDRIPIGIFYRGDPAPGYETLEPALSEGPLNKKPLSRLSEQQIKTLMAEVS